MHTQVTAIPYLPVSDTVLQTRPYQSRANPVLRRTLDCPTNAVLNRIQALVLGFFGLAWASLLVILVVAPEIYDQALGLASGDHHLAELAFLGALTAFIAVLSTGVLRRWRWMFWFIMIAFFAGVLRVPASVLQLTGALPPAGPNWYILLQAVLGMLQFGIGLAMLAGLRRAGVWGGR